MTREADKCVRARTDRAGQGRAEYGRTALTTRSIMVLVLVLLRATATVRVPINQSINQSINNAVLYDYLINQ